jgi:hypothetical protein
MFVTLKNGLADLVAGMTAQIQQAGGVLKVRRFKRRRCGFVRIRPVAGCTM